MRSSNGFTQRLELTVPDAGLPCLVDGLVCALACLFAVYAIGPAAWWWALIALPFGTLAWRQRLAEARRRGPDRLILTVGDRWLMQRRGAGAVPAALGAGWLVGRYCGLLLLEEGGRPRRFYFSAGQVSPESWRRLRVRLRLPRSSGLT